jgi:hypothetical protein
MHDCSSAPRCRYGRTLRSASLSLARKLLLSCHESQNVGQSELYDPVAIAPARVGMHESCRGASIMTRVVVLTLKARTEGDEVSTRDQFLASLASVLPDSRIDIVLKTYVLT